MSIIDLIEDNWDADNTHDITPSFSTGWYDKGNTTPQVTVTGDESTAVSGGNTGFFGLAVNGVPAQYWMGSLQVDCWVTRESSSINPKKLVYAMKEEIKRIIKANYDGISGLDFIVWRGSVERVDDTQTPVTYRRIGECGYAFMD